MRLTDQPRGLRKLLALLWYLLVVVLVIWALCKSIYTPPPPQIIPPVQKPPQDVETLQERNPTNLPLFDLAKRPQEASGPLHDGIGPWTWTRQGNIWEAIQVGEQLYGVSPEEITRVTKAYTKAREDR